MWGRVLAVAIAAMPCANCGGQIVKDIQSRIDLEGRADGAVIGYYLPKSLWHVAASFDAKTGQITLTGDAKPATVADTDAPMYYLSYAHAGFSDDDIDVQLNGLLLSGVASKASDQTVKVADAAVSLLTEVGAAQTALRTAQTIKYISATDTSGVTPLVDASAGCTTDLQTEATVNLSSPANPVKQLVTQWGKDCLLTLGIKVKRVPVMQFKTIGSAAPFGAAQDLSDVSQICERAVCFRPSQLAEVSVTVGLSSDLVGKDGKPKPRSKEMNPVKVDQPGSATQVPYGVTKTYNSFVVPSASAPLGFVEFGRRAFVENHTTITFTDGVVSDFKSTDPSIIAPAINLSTDLLKAVVLTVPIVR
jgi:hypothetical protein